MGLTSSFFFLDLLSSPSASPAAFLLPSCADFWDCRNSAIKSGQSKLSSGSHVLSSLWIEVHKNKYSCILLMRFYWAPILIQFQTETLNTFITTHQSHLLRETFPLEEVLYSPFHHPPIQDLFHHIFFLLLLFLCHIIRLLVLLLS